MTEAHSTAAANLFSWTTLAPRDRGALRQGDMLLALGAISILVVPILPLPHWLLDICLAFSITTSVVILLTSLFIHRPLEFNAFPTILLLSTMIRLALNMAPTRLILTHGHEGRSRGGWQ